MMTIRSHSYSKTPARAYAGRRHFHGLLRLWPENLVQPCWFMPKCSLAAEEAAAFSWFVAAVARKPGPAMLVARSGKGDGGLSGVNLALQYELITFLKIAFTVPGAGKMVFFSG
ncbi:MAG TPA: hypothetical protein ENK27_10895 [Desulfobulbus sp.]|nr:hypothetical protein [Desulfobulbus sp.]